MPTYEPFDWYHTPVYYDIIFDTDTAKEATFLEQVYARHADPPHTTKPTALRRNVVGSVPENPTHPLTILEPACGSGRLMAELAARGHRVAGCDLSKPMLDFARQRFADQGVAGKLVNAPMQNFDLHKYAKPRRGQSSGGGFDLAHILVSSFKYLLTDHDAAAALHCICDHLRPGGIFVLGIHLCEYDTIESCLERWRAKRDHTDVICTIKSWPPDPRTRLEKIRSRIVARDPRRPHAEPKRYESNWDFRTYDEAQLLKLLAAEPRFEHIATYTFDHDIEQTTRIGSDDLGLVLVLRRTA